MNLKIRINLIVTMILAFVMIIGAWMMIENAREDIRAEVDSTTALASHLLDAEISHFASKNEWSYKDKSDKASLFRLQSLDNVRHLRIEFFDATGKLIDSNQESSADNQNSPPVWFQKLIKRVSPSLTPTHRTIVVNNQVLGELVVTPDPSYEIAEIWHDTFGLISLGFLLFTLVNGILYWAIDSALRPLNKILSALTELELGHLNARLPLFSLPELSTISIKFNAMAQTLENSMSRNHSLTQKIIRLQEDERKKIAQDLHDEIGQHLTAINIDASAILKAKDIKHAHQSATAISDVVMQMISIVREMLHRLRPATLDELGLKTALHELLEGWRIRNREISISYSIVKQLSHLNETVAITVYRIVQESLTNISKHAQASFVIVKVEIVNDHLHVFIKDDGHGFKSADKLHSFGLKGMRERVEGLGGVLDINSEPFSGVSVKVLLPIHFKGMS
ncbi:MAG TPA: histidine kinase [Methylophilus sp.]|nr:histidine kinase [Methylophilus sp.]HQQ33975.1 histidine kinase [Methylophilus sp.]